ncbi:MAG: histidine phosphatase family protein, partial [Alphaproteobacteria bacterium]|nr:histidine phosphatase family protein [Alphaproteobacteria bacterium]
MTALVLLRHGQSVWNRQDRFTGWVDVDLTEAGVGDAERAGDALKAGGVDFEVCSTSVI